MSRWPVYDPATIAAVAGVLRSGRVNALHHGDRCAAFEQAFARICRQPHAIAVANGTLALELALRALQIGVGDEVIVPARSFMATASCVMACGATPVFADVDPVSQGLDACSVAHCLSPRTRAVIVVHLGGYPCAVDDIATLARDVGIALVEDCAQAHGATLHGRPVGSFGDAAAFSFCTDKIISTGGEGGMLVLRDAAVADRAWSWKDHGKDRRSVGAVHEGHGFRWLHGHFGSNYRLTEMQAAIGLCQLDQLDDWIARRRANAAVLLSTLRAQPALRLIEPAPGIGNAYYKFYAFVRPERLRPGWNRDEIIEACNARGVPCQAGTCPEIYLEAAFVKAGIGPRARLPIALELGMTSLCLPVDPTLDHGDCVRMGEVLAGVVHRATDHAR
ncbi:MAG TPA: DegT/DnrJ/EryC1/StrS aminotransferase family protein [Sphingomonas sp.]|nr:DegT/DnrJ/EryC1/StrS aminotransferase family protein [Sphingomonas sp.]